MQKVKYSKMFCCLNNLSAFMIELVSFTLAFVGIFIIIILYYLIPWNYLQSFEKHMLICNVYFYSSILIIISLLMLFRLMQIIYTKLYRISYSLFFAFLFEDLLGLFCSTYLAISINNTLFKKFSKYQVNKINLEEELTLNELIIILFLLILTFINWVILILLSLSEHLRIKLKLHTSYNHYCRAIDLEIHIKTISESNIMDESMKKEKIKELTNLTENKSKIGKIFRRKKINTPILQNIQSTATQKIFKNK